MNIEDRIEKSLLLLKVEKYKEKAKEFGLEEKSYFRKEKTLQEGTILKKNSLLEE